MPRKRAATAAACNPASALTADGKRASRWEQTPEPAGLCNKTVYGQTADECARKLRAATAAVDEHTYTSRPRCL